MKYVSTVSIPHVCHEVLKLTSGLGRYTEGIKSPIETLLHSTSFIPG